MRILQVTDCYRPRTGGIESQVETLATSLGARGHEVEVLTATPDTAGSGAEKDTRGVAPVTRLVARDGRGLPGGLPILPGGGGRIDAALAAWRWDAAHVHIGQVSPFAVQVATRLLPRGTPLIVTFHSRQAGLPRLLSAPGLRALTELDALPLGIPRVLLRAAADPDAPVLLSAVSGPVAADLGALARGAALAPGAEVALLPGAIDTAFWSARASGATGERTASSGEGLHLVTAGRLAPRKEIGALLVALAVARRRAASHLRLTVLGDGPLRRGLAARARVLGLGDAVAFAGAVSAEDLRAAYAGADAFVAPARHEAFGLAALEARAAGLPLVAPRGSGVETFATHGTDALLVRPAGPARPGGLADALVALADDPDLRRRLRAGAARPRPGHAAADQAARLEDLLRALVSGLPPRLDA